MELRTATLVPDELIGGDLYFVPINTITIKKIIYIIVIVGATYKVSSFKL